jgi:hypothetical protein
MGSISAKRGGGGGKNAPPDCYVGYMDLPKANCKPGTLVWQIIADIVILIVAWIVYQVLKAIGIAP